MRGRTKDEKSNASNVVFCVCLREQRSWRSASWCRLVLDRISGMLPLWACPKP